MEFNLPTKAECDEIVKNSDAFYRADRVVEGFNVAIYDYRLASLNDFVSNKAFELRGLCFIQDSTGYWERNILMQKFFNISQTEGWLIEDVKDKKIARVQNKEDGSIISFCRFPNGAIRAKSKTSFDSDQAKMAQEIYEKDSNLRYFIKEMMDMELTPIFELVGMDNQIVLEYSENELILLQIRFNETGEYHTNIPDIANHFKLKYTKEFNLTLDEMLRLKETSQEPIEGWVVTFEDSQMAKIKTNKYLSLHGLVGPDAFRENLLIGTIIDGNIDDVISALVPGEKRDRIIAIQEKVDSFFNSNVILYKELRRKYFQDFEENRKDFALAHSKDALFSSVMKGLNSSFRDVEETAEKAIKEYIRNKTKSLGDAKEFLLSI